MDAHCPLGRSRIGSAGVSAAQTPGVQVLRITAQRATRADGQGFHFPWDGNQMYVVKHRAVSENSDAR